MYDNQIFSNGVHSVLIGHWKLSCETPLVIRNGLDICYSSEEATKTRNKDIKFSWRGKDATNKKEYEVATLHYGYKIENSKVISYHFVPPSSVRGALRSWTINHLVQPEFRSQMTPPPVEEKEETEEYFSSMERALANPGTGYPLVAGLFGLAIDTREESGIDGNAGRFRLETDKFSQAKARPIAINGNLLKGDEGPDNARREMVVRNPLDRITHASQDGGLHHFLEFCKGETFGVHLTILNLKKSDLGLINLWVREMNDGFLRIGALSSVGRGRLSVQEQTYQLWQMPQADAWVGFTACEPPDGEVLGGFWQCSGLPEPEKTLPAFEKDVVAEIGGQHARP